MATDWWDGDWLIARHSLERSVRVVHVKVHQGNDAEAGDAREWGGWSCILASQVRWRWHFSKIRCQQFLQISSNHADQNSEHGPQLNRLWYTRKDLKGPGIGLSDGFTGLNPLTKDG